MADNRETNRVNDGGSAFPIETTSTPWSEGMTLRDWFAGQAMQGMLAHNSIVEGRLLEFFGKPGMNRYAVCATAAYVVADAMIEARKVKP